MELKPKYGLFTAFTMIVGIVIGSGIFFKADDILTLTGGNIALGALAFAVAAIAIVFGGLAFAQLASLTDSPGGLVAYAQEFGSRRLACAAGWFQTFFYYPSLISVVSSVVGVYLALLFGQDWSLGTQVLVGGGFLLLCYLYNTLSPKFGGAFQRLSSVVKLIPLLLFAAVGMLFGDPSSIVPPQTGSAFAALGWTAALAPIAFSFDGWIVATSIAHEVRDAKRNLRIALIAAPLLVLAIYLLYFVGVSCYLGPERVMALGDAHIDVMAGDLLGPWGAKAVLVFVLISVMGTVNGLVMGSIRMPHALALRGMVPGAATLERVNAQLDIPVPSAILSFAASALWLGLHYWSQRGGWLPNADLSECTVAFSYLFYMAVYFLLIRLFFRGKAGGWVSGVLIPLLATLGGLLILAGGTHNPLFWPAAAVVTAVLAAAVWRYGGPVSRAGGIRP
ncbi:APC family permease [Acetanaerobacterium sp. MSJ-12]|uniref:APC family permease n=1 Tax=Acetanaerobacterium sp. MSJ-12 TaxID=2841535 RepID=UPI00336BE0D4